MILYAACNGSGGHYDPADAYLYDWFRTEAEAIRYTENKLGNGGCIFRVEFVRLDEEAVIALIEQSYLDEGLATVEVVYP